MKTKDKEHRRVVILLSAITVLLVVILFASIFYLRSSRPMRQARNEAIEIAERYTDLAEVEQFYWFTREETSFSIVGKDTNNNEIVVIIPKSGEKVSVSNQADGLTEAQAKAFVRDNHQGQEIQKAALGIFEGEPTWEVMTKDGDGRLNYYLIGFKDGEEIKAITEL
ncbi:cell wall elongation regulator TseB-like domain-containing protein [Enterococcus casseliflavus]|uniref:cell wall elongation regulator TseB-like domain-containing protein n=1 Tax=Enterococcus casseliflavus TaxID=37734 RepID=UPI0007642DDB|nr:DUF5590 domain-containing protein [Enterococcus casseliflavus]OJG29332.1 hypothetical protein RU99_GL001605 [Enterococcus casseliflavus]QQU21794.1 DUF5590 domain-containing protein [Enterococcus casseliflavus]STQ31474.1 peptidase propeptide and YPEB domain-containing protein [Enterococcus casseliflavus]